MLKIEYFMPAISSKLGKKEKHRLIERNPHRPTSLLPTQAIYTTLLTTALMIGLGCADVHSKNQHVVAKWPLSENLRQISIVGITHGTDQMLWLVTQAGVTRFNGIEFVDYAPFTSGKGHIESANIISILAPKDGSIYAASRDAGLLEYDNIGDRFEAVQTKTTALMSTALSDASGHIWLGYRNGEIYQYSPRTRELQNTDHKLEAEVSSFTQAANGDIYASSKDGKIHNLSSDDKGYRRLGESCSLNHSNLVTISWLGDSQLMLGSAGSGLFLLDTTTGECNQIGNDKDNAEDITRANVRQIYHDSTSGLTWVASDQGLYKLDRDYNTTQYSFDNSDLFDNAVTSASPDSDGVIWVGTYLGLNYLVTTAFEMKSRSTHEKLHSLVSIANSTNGNLWIATYEGLLYFDNPTSSYLEFFDIFPSSQITAEKIMSLHSTPNDLWIGYRSSGVEHLSSSNGTKRIFRKNSESPLSSDSISSILAAKSGITLVGTYGAGLNLLSESGEIEHLSVGDNRIIMLHETSDGIIWIGTESGLYQLRLESRVFQPVEPHYNSLPNLPKPVIWSMAESSTGDLWFGTMHNGIYTWPLKTRTSESTSSPKRVSQVNHSASTVYAIETDNLNNVWYSTNLGLARFEPSTGLEQEISTKHGLQISEFDFGVSNRDESGNLYFGGSWGYIKFNPRELSFSSSPPSIKIIRIDTLDSWVSPPATPTTLQLTHKDYFVKFDFAVLDFLDPEKNQYRYKLEGFDPDWVENGTSNSATYTNLPPGDYVLRVQGANSAGVWNREGASQAIQVLPPPWKTWWAYSIYGAILLILIWIGKRAYDSYAIESRAKQIAIQMHAAAERADDEMQEQLEIQGDLVNSVYRHNMSTLQLVSDCIALQCDYVEDDLAQDSTRSSIQRVELLAVLEGCVYYQDQKVLADLHKFTEIIISRMLKHTAVSSESIATINEVSSQLIPIEVASPLGILIGELLRNCFEHAFDNSGRANYIHIQLELKGSGTANPTWQLNVQDNGLGIPSNINTTTPETAGLAIAAAIAVKLSGVLHFTSDKGTRASVTFPATNSA